GGFGLTWQQALAATFIAGALFLASALFKVRSKLMDLVPEPLRHGIVAGIGLMIAVIGLRWAGLLVATPSIYIGPGDIAARPVQVALVGLAVTAILVVRRVPGALLLGAGASGVLSLAFGLTEFTGVVSAPPSILPTLFAVDFGGLFAAPTWIFAVVVLLIVDMFDTIGTLLGVTSRAGLMRDGRLPRAEAAFASDAGGTMVGSLLGTSTITTYIESAAGVAAGGRTGLTALTTAGLLLASMFFHPLLSVIGGVPFADGVTLYPVAAPILILIGIFMMPEIAKVPWDRPVAAIPAFFVVVGMPLTTSITNGIGAGFIAWSALHLLTGKGREVSPVTHALAGLFVLLFVLE
ncbi:MAG: NCS2 family permease, partial [Acidobacteriota bacterium]|nr:NCS2 family permease [Acidobacteriota bacterium]